MSKVFFSVTMSLDGFIAPEQRFDDVGDKRWFGQWMELQKYALAQKFLRERLQIGEGGETGDDNRMLEAAFARTGVSIMGKRMFDGGERGWPEEAPFRTPVIVLTRQKREPWPRKGGTTFYFENGGIERALATARELAGGSGGKDVRIAGGAHVIRSYLNAGLVDDFHIALAPMLLGSGTSLFGGVAADQLKLDIIESVPTAHVTHLRYTVSRRSA